MAARVPHGLKYQVAGRLRVGRMPYSLVHPDSVVVQIGAPADTLRSGRSRAMHFALRTREFGQTIVIEPDGLSVEAFRQVAASLGVSGYETVQCGVWSKKDSLRFFINDAHPASNFTGGTVEYSESELSAYRTVEVPVRTLDDIVASLGLNRVDLVSITTNGAEEEILKGMSQTMAAGLRYISLARTEEGYVELLRGYGYKFLAHDDRGFTFASE